MKLLAGVAVAGMSVVSLGAQAAPIAVTIDPSVLASSITGPFSATSFQLQDDATNIIQNGTGAFTETGTLTFLSFANGSTTLSSNATGLRNGAAGTTSNYGLYLTFTASGTVPGFNSASPSTPHAGTFNNISYTLYGNPGNVDTVAVGGALTQNGSNTVLATGGVPPFLGPNDVEITNAGTPFVDVGLTLLRTTFGSTYFTGPTNLGFQEDVFTNNTSQFTFTNNGASSTLLITAGGGSGTFGTVAPTTVPEPASIALLGAGLFGLGLIQRRKKNG